MKKCPKCNIELELVAACEPWSDEHLICPICDGTSSTFTTQEQDNESWRIQSDHWPDRPKDPDEMRRVLIEATKDLHLPDGKLSASKVAVAFGVSPEALEGLNLHHFEMAARLRVTVSGPNFQRWLRIARSDLEETPLDALLHGKSQIVAELVWDMLKGPPS